MKRKTNGRILKEERVGHGLTQAELADLVGVSKIYISYLENDHYQPSISLVRKLRETLQLSDAQTLRFLGMKK